MDAVQVRWGIRRGFEFHVPVDTSPDAHSSERRLTGGSQKLHLPTTRVKYSCCNRSRLQGSNSPAWTVWTSPLDGTAAAAEDTADADLTSQAAQVELTYEKNFLLYSNQYLNRTSIFWKGLMFVLFFSTLMPLSSLAIMLASNAQVPIREGAGFDETSTSIVWTLKSVVFLLCFPSLFVIHALLPFKPSLAHWRWRHVVSLLLLCLAMTAEVLETLVGLLTNGDAGCITCNSPALRVSFHTVWTVFLGFSLPMFLRVPSIPSFWFLAFKMPATIIHLLVHEPRAIDGVQLTGRLGSEAEVDLALAIAVYVGVCMIICIWVFLFELSFRNSFLASTTAQQERQNVTDFLSFIVHELRNPLNALNGNCDLLADDERLDAEQAEQIHDMQLSCRQMRAVMTDVLDMNKIASGAMTLERVPFSVDDIALKTIRQFRGVAELRNLSIMVFVASNVPDMVLGDPSRVAQCLTNLVSNACKFVPEKTGRIHIYISSAEVLRTVTTDSKYLLEPSSASLQSHSVSDPADSFAQNHATPGPAALAMARMRSSDSPLRRPRRHSVSGSTTTSPKLSTVSDRDDIFSELAKGVEGGSDSSKAAKSPTSMHFGALSSIPMADVHPVGSGGPLTGRRAKPRRKSLQDYRTFSKSQGNLLAASAGGMGGGGTAGLRVGGAMPHAKSLAATWNKPRAPAGTPRANKPKVIPAEAPAQVQLLFQVVDNGPGLQSHEQKRLFKSFQQARASVARQHGGSGLGLMIVKTLCQSMGGTAAVCSAPGAGSNFWFSIQADVALPAAVKHFRKKNSNHTAVDVNDSKVGMQSGVLSIDDSAGVSMPDMPPDFERHVSGASSLADGGAGTAAEVERFQSFAAAVTRLSAYKAFLSVPATPVWAAAKTGQEAQSTWAPLQAETAEDVSRLLGTANSTDEGDAEQGSMVFHAAPRGGAVTKSEAQRAAARNTVPPAVWRRVEMVMSKQHAHRRRTSVTGSHYVVHDQESQNAADAAARVISGATRGLTQSGGDMSTPRGGASDVALIKGAIQTNAHESASSQGGRVSRSSDMHSRGSAMAPARGGGMAANSDPMAAVRLGTGNSATLLSDTAGDLDGPHHSLPMGDGTDSAQGSAGVTSPQTLGHRAKVNTPAALWTRDLSERRSASASSPIGPAPLLTGTSAPYQYGASSGAGSQRSGLQPGTPMNAASPRRAVDASLMLADINAAGRNVPNTTLDPSLAASIHQSAMPSSRSGRSGRSGRRRASDGHASAAAASAAAAAVMQWGDGSMNSDGARSLSGDRQSVSGRRRASDPPRFTGGVQRSRGAPHEDVTSPLNTSHNVHSIAPVTELSTDMASLVLSPLLRRLCLWRPTAEWPSVASEQTAIVEGLANLRVQVAAGALKEEQFSPSSARGLGGRGKQGTPSGGEGGGTGDTHLPEFKRPAASRYMARCDDGGDSSVFIADDDGTQRRMMGNTLKRHRGLREERFTDGLALLEGAMGCLPWSVQKVPGSSCALGEKARVICFDVNMSPGMGGVPATRLLRLVEVAFMRRVTPVIAVTANSDIGDRALYARSGMSALVGKPLDRSHLLMTVERLFRKRSVMVVTDDMARAEGAAAYMRELGHNVVGVLDSAKLLGIALGTIVDAGQAARVKLGAMSDKIKQQSSGAASGVHSVELQEAALEHVWQRCMLLSCRAPWHSTWGEEVQRRLAETDAARTGSDERGGGTTGDGGGASRPKATMHRGLSGVSGVSSGVSESVSAAGGVGQAGDTAAAAAAAQAAHPAEYPVGTRAELKRLREQHQLGLLQPWGVDAVLVLTWHDAELPNACLDKWHQAIPGPMVPFLHLHHGGVAGASSVYHPVAPFVNTQPPLHAPRGLFWRLAPDEHRAACLPCAPSTSPKTSAVSQSHSLSSGDGGYAPWQAALAEVLSLGPLLGTPADPLWAIQEHHVVNMQPLLTKNG